MPRVTAFRHAQTEQCDAAAGEQFDDLPVTILARAVYAPGSDDGRTSRRQTQYGPIVA